MPSVAAEDIGRTELVAASPPAGPDKSSKRFGNKSSPNTFIINLYCDAAEECGPPQKGTTNKENESDTRAYLNCIAAFIK